MPANHEESWEEGGKGMERTIRERSPTRSCLLVHANTRPISRQWDISMTSECYRPLHANKSFKTIYSCAKIIPFELLTIIRQLHNFLFGIRLRIVLHKFVFHLDKSFRGARRATIGNLRWFEYQNLVFWKQIFRLEKSSEKIEIVANYWVHRSVRRTCMLTVFDIFFFF